MRQYAQHRKNKGLDGTSHQAVSKAIASGRISAQDQNGWLDFAKADAEWAQNTKYQHLGPSAKGPQPAVAAAAPPAPASQPPASMLTPAQLRQHYDAELLRHKAERERVELEARVGQLVEVAVVKRVVFTLMRGVRDSVLGIDPRCRSSLALARTAEDVSKILVPELAAALTDPNLEELLSAS